MFEQKEFDENHFHNLCNNFRSPHIWYYENEKWNLRKKVE